MNEGLWTPWHKLLQFESLFYRRLLRRVYNSVVTIPIIGIYRRLRRRYISALLYILKRYYIFAITLRGGGGGGEGGGRGGGGREGGGEGEDPTCFSYICNILKSAYAYIINRHTYIDSNLTNLKFEHLIRSI